MSNQVKGWKKGLLVWSTLSMLIQPVMAQQYVLRVPIAGISSQSSGTIEITPSPIVFQGSTPVGTAAPSMTVAVANNSFTAVKNVAVTLASGGADFTQTSDCPVEMAGRTSCKVTVGFKPSSAGELLGSLAISSNAANGLQMAQIRGSAVVPSATLHADNFPTVQVQRTSSAAVTLTNSSNSSITVTPAALAAPFSIASTTCTESLAAGASCSYQLNFSPLTAGTYSRDWVFGLMVGSYAFSRTVPLSGIGANPSATLSNVEYTSMASGQTVQKSAVLTNLGQAPLSVGEPTVTGSGFALGSGGTCGTSLAAGATCTFTIDLTAVGRGTMTGSLSVPTGAGTKTASLTGLSQQANLSLSQSVANLGSVQVGQNATSSTYTLNNNGDIAATDLAITASGAGFEVVNSTCGTSLPVSTNCSFAVKFSPTAVDTFTGGVSVTSATSYASMGLSGTGVSQPQVSLSANALTFGSLNVGTASTAQSVNLTNSGTQTMTLTAPAVTGSNAYVATSTCSATLAAGESCSTSVVFTPNATGSNNAVLSFVTNAPSSPNQVSLSGTGLQAVGSLSANSSTDFGTLSLNTTSTRVFTFTNTGNITATGVNAALVTGSEMTITANTCGTSAAPVSIAAGNSCSMTLTWTPTTDSSAAGSTLTVTGAFNGGSKALNLTGTAGSFNAAATWSSTANTTTALTAATNNIGEMTSGVTTATKTFYLNNTGTYGALAAGFTLSGDTGQFKISNVYKTTTSGSYASCGSTITGGLTATKCTADKKNGGAYLVLRVDVMYAPTVTGAHSVTLTPISGNGAAMPVPITLTGSSVYDPVGVWSSTPGSTVALTAANTAFGVMTTGVTTATKEFVVRNVGTHGSLSESFQLSGDTAQFKISSVCTVSGGNGWGSCVSPNSASSTVVTAQDVYNQSYTNLRVTVVYAPTADGSHSVTLTPTSGNGYPAPAPITLSGSSVYDAAGVWSSTTEATVALTAVNTTFSAQTTGVTTATKEFFVRNVGTHGSLAESFQLSGDAAQFKITHVCAVHPSYTWATTGCVAPNSASSTVVTAPDIFSGGYYNLKVVVMYAPTVSGNHSVTLTPTSGNGYPAPAPITLSGSSVYDAAGVWSSTTEATVALTAVNTTFSAQTTGVTTATKEFFVRNVGTHGSLAESFQLSGDAAQFKITQVCAVHPSYTWATTGCVAPNSASSTVVTAPDIFSGGYYNLKVVVMYAPTVSGNHSVTLTPTSGNGYPAPAPITLSGSSVYDAAGVWSSTTEATVALTAVNTTFSAQTTGVTTATKEFFVRNVGTHGSLAESFQLSGDAAQFKITHVCAVHPSYTWATTGCVAPNSASSTVVTAPDIFSGGYYNLKVVVMYAPTVSGNHSVTLTPTSGNGYPAPAPITLSGSAV